MSATSRLHSLISGLVSRPRTASPRPARRARVQVEGLDGRLLLTAGALDTTFGPSGEGGRFTSDAAQYGNAVVTQDDGKIVVAGNINSAETLSDFVLTRFHADGTPDVAFGDGGRVVLDFYGGPDIAYAVAVQPDLKILVAGYAFTPDTDGNPRTYENTEDFALARFHADGTIDASFGTGGKVTVNMSTTASLNYETARAILLQGDKIVVGGDAMGGSGPDFALARFDANGTLDTSFGAGGKVLTNFDGSSNESLRALALQADDKLVAAGSTSTFKTSSDFGLARYNANGSLDTTFDLDGKVSTDFATKGGKTPASDEANGLVIQPDGKIVLVGSTRNGPGGNGFALARYSAKGALDTSFGAARTGKVITDFGGAWATATSVALQVVGGQTRIVVAGSVGPFGQTDFAAARYNANGILDTSFDRVGNLDGDGKVITTFFSQQGTTPVVAIQADGKFLAVGSAYDGTRYKLALARYLGA